MINLVIFLMISPAYLEKILEKILLLLKEIVTSNHREHIGTN